MNKKSIGLILPNYYIKTKQIHGVFEKYLGGAERYFDTLIKLLKELNYQITVYQLIAVDNIPEGTFIIEQLDEDLELVSFIVEDFNKTAEYGTFPSYNSAVNNLAKAHDLVIYGSPHVAYPKVIHPGIVINHGIFWDYEGSAVDSDEAVKKEFLRRIFNVIAQSDLYVAVDTNVKNVIRAYNPSLGYKIKYVPNFVDTNIFTPRTTPKNWDNIRVLFPRRVTPVRGSFEFINTATKLPEYEFIVAGQKSINRDNTIKKNGNITFIEIPLEGMPELYKQVDIVVIPTISAEGTSFSCIESMACGLPVITTVVGGLPNLVINNYNGFLIDLDFDKLEDYIKILAENEELRKTFGMRGIEIVKENFTLERWKNDWKQIINKFI